MDDDLRARLDDPVTLPTDLPVLTFPDQAAFEQWLEAEHETAPGLYVQIAKKGSGVPSVTAAEVVESALCFGWIDGRGNRLDDRWFLLRMTPRRKRSVWSQKNVGTVEALTAAGRMRPAGLAAVEAAKADGRWERAYAGSATITVPHDLAAALAAEPAAIHERATRSLFQRDCHFDRPNRNTWPLARDLLTCGVAPITVPFGGLAAAARRIF